MKLKTFLLIFSGELTVVLGLKFDLTRCKRVIKIKISINARKKDYFNVNVTSLKVMSLALMIPSQENSKNCKNVEGRNKGGNG